MTDKVNEAVAFAVELPDGSVSEFGWQDMRTFKHAQRIAVLDDGCRYVFAYRPTHLSRGVVDEAIDERASFEADYLRRFNAPGRLGMNAEGCYGHLMTRCRFEGWQARAALQAAALPADHAMTCTCPSGDGSLRWPCPQHPPTSDSNSDLHQHLLDMLGAKDHVDAGRIIGELHAALPAVPEDAQVRRWANIARNGTPSDFGLEFDAIRKWFAATPAHDQPKGEG